MNDKRKVYRFLRYIALCFVTVLLFILGTVNIAAEDEEETVLLEYGDFIDSLDPSVTDKLPDSAFSSDPEEIEKAAKLLSDPQSVLSMMLSLLGDGIKSIIPTLVIILGVVILASLVTLIASNCGGLSRSVEICIRLCTFCSISGVATYCVKSLSVYFERLFAAMTSFVPLSAALFAMGGNLNAAVTNSASLGTVLTVCEFFFTKTAIPLFSVCLCLSLLSVFDGIGSVTGGSISARIRKWYMTALSFLTLIMTFAIAGSNLLASKADNLAMRGMKFAVSSFVPVSGGTLSSTLGTLAASVEVLRGSVGVIGIAALLFLLLPTVIELALLRGVFAICGFCASVLGCSGESKLLGELDSLYGFLEGLAALSAAVFVIALGVFSCVATPFS